MLSVIAFHKKKRIIIYVEGENSYHDLDYRLCLRDSSDGKSFLNDI